MKTHVLVMAYNCFDFFPRCLESVFSQTPQDFNCLVIDDASPDLRQVQMTADVATRPNYSAILNPVNVKATANIWNGVKALEPDVDDVIILMDGDDWFKNPTDVAHIAAAYEDPEIWMTYGSYDVFPHRTLEHPAEPYPDNIIDERAFRGWSNFFNHPISFRRILFDQFTEADLQDDQGNWFASCYDEALMYNMLEMCGRHHYRWLEEELYVYNAYNPLSDTKVHMPELIRDGYILRERPRRPLMRREGDVLVPA